MSAPTIERPRVDEMPDDLIEALSTLRPPCEARNVIMAGDVVVTEEPCDRAADWCIRTLCTCGYESIDLICDEHEITRPLIFSCKCGLRDSVARRTRHRL